MKSQITLSVALCTFNGERYLPQQLHSITTQMRRPDELVVFDDASTDDTATIIRQFAADAPFPVSLFINERNVGSTGNFEKAIAACEAEVIALCDQDDVWLPEKLAVLERALAERPAAGFVFSDAAVVDERLNRMKYTLWQSHRITRRQVRAMQRGEGWRPLLKRNLVTGATMAFRSRYRDLLLPIPAEWVHDGWIALLLACVAPAVATAQSLLHYRQHGGQQIGGAMKSYREQFEIARRMDRETFAAEAERYRLAQQRLIARAPHVPAGVLRCFAEKIAHFENRVRMRAGSFRLPLIASELLRRRYGRYSVGLASVAQDLFM